MPATSDLCSEENPDKTALKQPTLTQSEMPVSEVPATIDSDGDSDKTALKQPILTHSETSKSLQCFACDEQFNDESDFNQHIQIHCEISLKSYQCNVCDEEFNDENDFNQHIQIHCETPLKSYQCHVCNEEFSDESALNEHITALKHQCGAGKEQVCLLPVRSAGNKSSINKVLVLPKIPQCSVCKKEFSAVFYLNQNNGNYVKLYQCDVCRTVTSNNKDTNIVSKSVTDSTARKPRTARKSETGNAVNQPFQCTVCPKKFASKGNLKQHLFVHSLSRPFLCTVCHKKFSQDLHLKKHLTTHSGDRPFHCTLCTKKFAHERYLKQHCIRNHSIASSDS